MLEALRAVGTPVTEYINETKMAAMFEDANVTLLQERKIVQHLRHQFGTRTFATRKDIVMLCEGHTPVRTGCAMYAYKEGEEEERLEIQRRLRFDARLVCVTR